MSTGKYRRILTLIAIVAWRGGALADGPLPPASPVNSPEAVRAIGDKANFTSREVTDPLLEIRNLPSMTPSDPIFAQNPSATPDYGRKPFVINNLWGRKGVLVVDRFPQELDKDGEKIGGEVDFSAITLHCKGRLHLHLHNNPLGAAEVRLMKGKEVVATKMLSQKVNSWQTTEVAFDSEPVRLTLVWHGWGWEMAFFDYSVEVAARESLFSSPHSSPSPARPVNISEQVAQPIDNKADFTKREVTDPLLKIVHSNRTALFSPGDPFYNVTQPATPDFSRNPPVINHLWGRNGVLVVEPISTETKAAFVNGTEVDFSAITTNCKGKLCIHVHRHPGGAVEVQLFKGEKTVAAKLLKMNSNNWEIMQVDFDREPVRLKLPSHDWVWQTAFIDYSFAFN